MNKTCEKCGVEVERKGNRGPMPKRCADCQQIVLNERTAFQSAQNKERRHEKLAGRQCKICQKPLGVKQPTYCGKQCYYIDTFGWRDCAVCSKAFIATWEGQSCCGNVCAKRKTVATLREQAPKYIYTCQHCGKKYKAKKPDRNKYCTRECAFAAIAAKPVEPKIVQCKWCNKEFEQTHGILWCNDECRKASVKVIASEQNRLRGVATKVLKPRPCKECNKQFIPEYGNKRRAFCSDKCLKRNSGRKGKATRRARIAGSAIVEAINPLAVLSRDKWKCHMCGRQTPRRLRGTYEDNAPELDHIIPLAQGGLHTWDNVACACRKCNSDKGSQIIGQQLLPVFASIAA